MVEEIMKASTIGFMPNSYFHLSLVLGFVVLRINSGSFVLWASVLCLSTHRVLFFVIICSAKEQTMAYTF